MKRKIALLVMVMALAVSSLFGILTVASADDLIVEPNIGWAKNPWEPIKIVTFERVYDDENNEIGVKMGILGDYGQRAIKDESVDLSDIGFTVDLTEYKENSIYDIFMGDSSQCFPGAAGLGLNLCILKETANKYVCRINDGKSGTSESDQWNLYGGDKGGYIFTDGILSVHIVRGSENYTVTFNAGKENEDSVSIPTAILDANLGYGGGDVVKAYMVIGGWGDSSRLISKFLYYTDAEYERYLPVKAAQTAKANSFAAAVSALDANSTTIVEDIIAAQSIQEEVDTKALRKADVSAVNSIVNTARSALYGFIETLSKGNYTALITRYVTDFEGAVNTASENNTAENLAIAYIMRNRLVNSGYNFADSSLISITDKAALEAREKQAENKYWALIDSGVVEIVDSYVEMVNSAVTVEDFISAYEYRRDIDISSATVTTQEILEERLTVADASFKSKQVNSNWIMREKPVALITENGKLEYYSEAKIDGSKLNNEGEVIAPPIGEAIIYNEKFDITDFEISFNVNNFAKVSGSDGYIFVGLYEKADIHDNQIPNNNKGLCMKIVKNADTLSFELYAIKAISLIFTNSLRGIYYTDYPADGNITLRYKMMGGNLVVFVNGVVPPEYTAVKDSECAGMFGSEKKAYLAFGTHITPSEDVLNDTTLKKIGYGVTIKAINNNRLNAEDLTIWGEGDLDDEPTTSSHDGGTTSSAAKKGCGGSVSASGTLCAVFAVCAYLIKKRKDD